MLLISDATPIESNCCNGAEKNMMPDIGFRQEKVDQKYVYKAEQESRAVARKPRNAAAIFRFKVRRQHTVQV